MAEALKDSFGRDIPVRIAAMIEAVHPGFPTERFVADSLDGYDVLELTQRARQIASALATHLPADFEEAAPILVASLGPPIAGDELIGQGMALFLYLPHVFYVAEQGLEHWDTAMSVHHELTQRFSCEYSIRAYLEHAPERTLARLAEWTADPNPHVRRLVSEGTRPRLPWAPRLHRFIDDPKPVIELLEVLKDDPTSLVRRSVANNLNDIGKDHPLLLVEVCRRWMTDAGPQRVALVEHALRSAIKRGDTDALAVLGFGSGDHARVDAVTIEPPTVPIGGRVMVAFTVTNTGAVEARYNVDLRVYFVKANGSASPKVFKGRHVELAPGASAEVSKTVSLAVHTTRTPYPGDHRIELVVNGSVRPLGTFAVLAR